MNVSIYGCDSLPHAPNLSGRADGENVFNKANA